MRIRTQLAWAAITAVALIVGLATSAGARNLEFSNSNFRLAVTPLAFSDAFGFVGLRCNITVEGSFHGRTIVKSNGALLGYITRASLAHPCTNGEAWAWNGTEGALTGASTLPWHVSYEGFTGILPNIATLRILLRNLKLSTRNGICLGTYAPANLKAIVDIAGDRTMTVRPEGENFTAIEGECPAARFTGNSGRVVLLGTTTAITIRLI